MRQTLLATCVVAAAFAASAYDAPADRHNYGNDFTGVAIVKGDGINLRMGPSVSDPYLCTVSGDELYFDPQNVQWSHTVGKYMDSEKFQLYSGQRLGVIGKEGEWSNLYLPLTGNSFDVWTMTKFLDILPITEVMPGMCEASAESNVNCFKQFGTDADNISIYYQEAGMDEDSGFYIGRKDGKTAVFDSFLPIQVCFEAEVPDFKVDQKDGMLYLYYGKAASVTPGEDYGQLDVNKIPVQLFKALAEYAQKIPAEDRPFAVGVSADEVVFFH